MNTDKQVKQLSDQELVSAASRELAGINGSLNSSAVTEAQQASIPDIVHEEAPFPTPSDAEVKPYIQVNQTGHDSQSGIDQAVGELGVIQPNNAIKSDPAQNDNVKGNGVNVNDAKLWLLELFSKQDSRTKSLQPSG